MSYMRVSIFFVLIMVTMSTLAIIVPKLVIMFRVKLLGLFLESVKEDLVGVVTVTPS